MSSRVSGERKILRNGYIMLRWRSHPRADETGYVYEHWVIAERALGHPLPDGAIVHHWEGKANTRGNLAVLPDVAYHAALHRRLRIFRAGGNPFTQSICRACRLVKDLSEFNKIRGIPQYRCKPCAKARRRKAA